MSIKNSKKKLCLTIISSLVLATSVLTASASAYTNHITKDIITKPTVKPATASYTPKTSMYGNPRITPMVPSNVILNPYMEMFVNQHEFGVKPNGLNPSTPWGYGSIIRSWMRPNWTRVGLWGQVYLEKGYTTIPQNVGIELRNFKMYIFNKNTNKWDVIHDVKFDHTNTFFYDDNYENDYNKPFSSNKKIIDGGKGIVIKWDKSNEGFNFHPYSQTKFDFVKAGYTNPYEMPLVISSLDARLVKWDQNGADNLNKAKFIFNVGGDYWDTYSDVWLPDWSANGEIGGGQFRTITPEWKTAWFTNVPEYLCDDIIPSTFTSN